MAGGNASGHKNHPDGITTLPRTKEGDMSPAEGKQANLVNGKQNASVTTETQLIGENKGEEAMTQETVRRSTRIAARGQKLDYSEFPRYHPPADWTQPYDRVEGVAIAQSRIPRAGYGLYEV